MQVFNFFIWHPPGGEGQRGHRSTVNHDCKHLAYTPGRGAKCKPTQSSQCWQLLLWDYGPSTGLLFTGANPFLNRSLTNDRNLGYDGCKQTASQCQECSLSNNHKHWPNYGAPYCIDVRRLALMVHDWGQSQFFSQEVWEDVTRSGWCAQLADEMHQERAGFTTAAWSQIRPIVSHFSVIFSEFKLEVV